MEYLLTPKGQSFSKEQSFSNSDRLGLMLFLAAVAHLVVILGITFSMPKTHAGLSGLNVTLVQTASPKPAPHATELAQANADGGGNSHRQSTLRSPFPIDAVSVHRAYVPAAVLSVRSIQNTHDRVRLLTGADGLAVPASAPTPHPPQPKQIPVSGLTKIAALNHERAELATEISRSWRQYERQPREKFISARTRAYAYARYMDAWKARVERIGNSHYPRAVRNAGLSGRLLIDVAINANGSLRNVHILRSSGSPVLDEAALRIVRRAAPFAPFPAAIRHHVDVLHIIRTWEFRRGAIVRTRGLHSVPHTP
ncbi:MAG: energy transducer TonB [Acidiferrobacteraceae bacterium]